MARDVSKRIYPSIPPKVKKERFLARKIISKFLLYDLSTLSLEEALEEYHLEKIEKNLANKNISFSREILIELVKDSLAEKSAKWINSDVGVQSLAINEKMKDTLFSTEHLANNFDQKEKEKIQFRLNAMEALLRGFSTFTKTNGIRDFNKKLMAFKAYVEIERLKASLSREDQEFLEFKITYMRATANPMDS